MTHLPYTPLPRDYSGNLVTRSSHPCTPPPPARFPRRVVSLRNSFLSFSLKISFSSVVEKTFSLIDKMRLLCGILVVFPIVILSNRALAADKKDTTKLQIGVKKRVADCQTRSKSGDTLHMHYKVSDTRLR